MSRRAPPSGSMVRSYLYDQLFPAAADAPRTDAKYPGELGVRLTSLSPSKTIVEAERRLGLLCDHLRVPRDDFEQLAVVLACRHVPGLRLPPRSPGRPRKEPASKEAAILQLIRKRGVTGRVRRGPQPALTEAQCIALVAEADRWKESETRRTGRRASDAAFVRHKLTAEAKEKRKRRHSYLKTYEARRRTQLSDARRRVRKLQEFLETLGYTKGLETSMLRPRDPQ